MTKLDDELEKAVASAEADAPVQAAVSRDAQEERKPRRVRNLRVLALSIGARARVAAILHQQSDDEDRLHHQQRACKILHPVNRLCSMMRLPDTLGSGDCDPNT